MEDVPGVALHLRIIRVERRPAAEQLSDPRAKEQGVGLAAHRLEILRRPFVDASRLTQRRRQVDTPRAELRQPLDHEAQGRRRLHCAAMD